MRTQKVAVIGEGIIGLTSAYRLLESGFAVTIFSKDDLLRSSSMAAGAYWWPHKASPQKRISAWAVKSFQRYELEKTVPETGVFFQNHYRFCIDPDDSLYVKDLVKDCEKINGQDYGVSCVEAYRVMVPVVDVPMYMPYLKKRVKELGGCFVTREFESLHEVFPEFQLAINCTGVWAKAIAKDSAVFPIKGQVVKVQSSPKITSSFRIFKKQNPFVLVLPRVNDCLLGGTTDENEWSTEVEENITSAIFHQCSAAVPELKNCSIIGSSAGLRPGRKEVRLEVETIAPGCPVIHNYGHGGSGFTVGWGCADEVLALAQTIPVD